MPPVACYDLELHLIRTGAKAAFLNDELHASDIFHATTRGFCYEGKRAYDIYRKLFMDLSNHHDSG